MGFLARLWGRVTQNPVYKAVSNAEYIKRIDAYVADSPVGRYFRLEGCRKPNARKGARFCTELFAGLLDFVSTAYVIPVNAAILAVTKGTCSCVGAGCEQALGYLTCVSTVQRDLIVATAIVAAVATFSMGMFANLPVVVAPGIGLSAFFTYNVVINNGVPYSVALVSIFVEGIIFFLIASSGLCQKFAALMPRCLKFASRAGIGLFLMLVGMTYSSGIGLVVPGPDTPLELAGCSPADLDAHGRCPSSAKMRNPALWLAVAGGLVTTVLMLLRVRAAIILGALFVSAVSWFRASPTTCFPHTPEGDMAFAFFKQVVALHPIERMAVAQTWDIRGFVQYFFMTLITFLVVNIMNTTAALDKMVRSSGLNEDSRRMHFERCEIAYMVDAVAVSFGALLGCPPVTVLGESEVGIAAGGKTGLTAIAASLCFGVCIFFSPIFASMPPWATGSVLILVGARLASALADINYSYLGDGIPALLAVAVTVFSSSLSYGLFGGLGAYLFINGAVAIVRKMTGHTDADTDTDTAAPPGKAAKQEPWLWRGPAYVAPPWVEWAFGGRPRLRFWATRRPRIVHPPHVMNGSPFGPRIIRGNARGGCGRAGCRRGNRAGRGRGRGRGSGSAGPPCVMSGAATGMGGNAGSANPLVMSGAANGGSGSANAASPSPCVMSGAANGWSASANPVSGGDGGNGSPV